MINEEFGSEKKHAGLTVSGNWISGKYMIFNKEFNFHEKENGAYERDEQVEDL